MDNQSQSQTLQRALLALEKMEARLKAAENAGREPIAIVGLGCRFPGGADDAESFWQLLRDGVDTVTEVPADRWDIDAYYDPDPEAPGKMYTRMGAFLQDVDQFDPQFFGIMPKEAHAMDPQQRLLLETTWEALENAGIAPDTLAGSRTGVYVGILGTDYSTLQTANDGIREIGPYYGSGVAHSIASGRISYLLGLNGPSMSIDTACSSSLVAIHQACMSLRTKETNLALAGGVNLILTPDASIALSKNKMMAADGHCKTFDASADGYVRGEGCGVVVLKRLSDAVADGNTILAVIRGTAVNQDGASSGLTAPNGPSQEAVIRDALANAGVNPHDVTYVETHGTGTSLGDPIEVQALASTLGKGRDPKNPLLVGSVKTNVGHLETAAGIVGLVKLIMSLRHKAIPPHLHLKTPNPFIPWAQLPVSIPTKLTPWPEHAPLIAGLSSFGFSGTNVHIVVSAPPERETKNDSSVERPSQILALSAKSEAALQALAQPLAAHLSEKADLANVAFTNNTGRAKYSHRLALWAGSAEEAVTKLKAFATGEEAKGFVSGFIPHSKRLKVAFLFTGQGAQYAGMGRGLYETQPVFRAALDECASLVSPVLDKPLLDVIFANEGSNEIDQTGYTQVALFAVEYSLAKLWQSWGVEPFAVMGHSVGEYVAACLAGVFSLEDGLKLIAERGRLMQSLPAGGRMSAVFAEEARVQEAIRPFGDRVSIAAINGPSSIVISGDGQAVESICAMFGEQGIKSRSLTVSHAFHSPLVEPILKDFEKTASTVNFKEPQLRLISNVTGELAMGDVVPKAAYWRDHIRQPVQFARGVESLLGLNVDVLIEVGPSPTLLGMTQRIPGADEKLSVPTLRQGKDDWTQILESLGKLFVAGVLVDWKGFDKPYTRKRLQLPTYPFQRQRYWNAPKSRRAPSGEENVHPLLGRKIVSPLKTVQFESYLDRESFSFIRDHQVRGTSLLPMTGYLEMAQAAAKLAFGAGEYELCDVVIHQPLALNEEAVRIAQCILHDDSSFEVYSRAEQDKSSDWLLHASGRVETFTGELIGEDIQNIWSRCKQEFSSQEHYEELHSRGFPFGSAMQNVSRIWRRDGEALVEIQAVAEIADEFAAYNLHPAVLDACLQGLWSTFDLTDKKTYMPMNFERFVLVKTLPQKVWSHIRLREKDAEKTDSVIGDVRVMDENGQTLAEINGLYFRPASQAMFKPQREWDEWLYEVDWQLLPDLETTVAAESSQISIKDISLHVDSRLPALSSEHQIERYWEIFPRLEQLSAGYVAAAFCEMGVQFKIGQILSAEALVSSLGIQARYRRLTSRLLEILGTSGYVEKVGTEWEVKQVPAEVEPDKLKAEWQSLLSGYPESKGQVTLTGQCGQSLGDVLRGKVDPLSLLFPDGSLELTELLYREAPQPRIFNTMVSNAVQEVIAGLPGDKPIRILEVGAGTGGTTSYVLPALPAERTEYYFTDLSPLFLNRARKRFEQFPFVRYEILNIENDPAAQGFENQSFDIVLAVNVLHATADMPKTLEHVRQVMKPNGVALFVEGTERENWVDITFGLTDGWWRFTDTDTRPDYPLMHRVTWDHLLASTGFSHVNILPLDETKFQQALILSQAATASAGQWLIVEDELGVGKHLGDRLSAFNQGCTFVKASEVQTTDDFKRLIARLSDPSSAPLRGVLHLGSLDMTRHDGTSLEDVQSQGLRSAMSLAQALAGSDIEPPRLWLVTRSAQDVDHKEALAPENATLWGLGKVIQLEHPELQCTRIDLDSTLSIDEQAALLFAQIWNADSEDQVALRRNGRYTARLKRTALVESSAGPLFDGNTTVQLQATGNGVLEDLSWQSVDLPQPGAGEVAIEVRAAGLNFRDLMNALAMRSDNEAMGGECSGLVIAVGEGVTEFKIGDAVMGMARGSFGSVAIASVDFVVHKPDGLSFAEAAALPIAYFTAYYCLHTTANISKGQKVLIHAAAGGVGLAAVQIALRAGAEIFATAGSDAKRDFLRSLGVKHILNSRTLDFADQMQSLTDGTGVDVVLNSLSGEFIGKSVSVLAEKGTFIEIGKREIWSQEKFTKEKPAATYHIIDLAAMTETDAGTTSPIFHEVMELVATGELKPLSITAFSARQAPEAFRYMAQAMQIGKIVITNHGYQLRDDGTYLITGGLAGLGLLTARHFAERGARYLVLAGRSAPSSIAETAIREMEASGVQIKVVQADVSKAEDVRHIVDTIKENMPPLRGVIHAAGVLDDASILRQEWSKFARVLAPKVDGSWYLHSFTLNQPLDFFILYSSTAALLGSPGQSNHSSANTFMDALAHYRQSHGLPALSINWGIWSVVGSAAERKADEWMLSQGVGTIKPEQGLAMLDLLFSQEKAQIGVLPIDWAKHLAQYKTPPLWLSLLAQETRKKGKKTTTSSAPSQKLPARAEGTDFREKLVSIPPNQQRQFLLEHIHAQVVKSIGLEAGQEIDPRQALNELGLDSLMAVELRNMLSNSLKLERNLPATLVFDYPTINALTDYLAQDILKLETKKEEKKVAPAVKTDYVNDIANLSDEEVARMLSDLQ